VGHCHGLQEHGMIEARQEARLAPILDWLCPYYRRDGDVEGDETSGSVLFVTVYHPARAYRRF